MDALDSDDKLKEPGFLLGTDDTEEQKSTLARNKTVSVCLDPQKPFRLYAHVVQDIITISDGATEDNSFIDYSLPPFTQIPVKQESSVLVSVPPSKCPKMKELFAYESKVKYI